jgi:hypothetical protein
MAAQTYQTISQAILAALAQAPPPYNLIPIDFQTLFPQAISYAENRIYRDIPMLTERQQIATAAIAAGAGSVSAPISSQETGPVFIERFGIIQGGTTYWFDKASADFVGLIWTNPNVGVDPDSAEWLGRYWAPFSDTLADSPETNVTSIVFAPPTATVGLIGTVVGLFPPAALSVTNAQTYLSTLYPDLLEAAIMVFMNRYLLKNASASADTPEMTMTFEDDYMRLMEGAKAEELRRRGIAPSVGLPSPPRAAAGAR